MAKKRIRFESKEQLDEIIRGGPCVVCGLHLGNWELVAYARKLMGAPFTGVYQRLSNPLCRRRRPASCGPSSTRAAFCRKLR